MRPALLRRRPASFVAPLFFMAVVGSAVPLDPSGDLDTTFHADGRASLNFAQVLSFAEARGAAVQSNGKIVVGGNSVEGGSTLHFASIRLNTDGTRDTSYGAGGTTKIPVGNNSTLNATAVYPNDGNPATVHDDKVVLAGFASMPTGHDEFVIVRLTVDGDIDATFGGGDGIVTVDFFGVTSNQQRANAVAVQDDGKIVAAGYRRDNSGGREDFALVRLNTDGTLDGTFGVGGRVITPVSPTTGRDIAHGVRVIGSGASRKILAAGDTRPAGSTVPVLAMVRYNNDGTLDGGFGTGGRSVIDLPGNTCDPTGVMGCGGDTLRDIAIQSDGKIVGTGNFGTYGTFPSTQAGLKSNMLTVRFTAGGALDTTTFAAPNGFVVTTVARGFYTDVGLSAAIGTDGKIVTFGWTDESTDASADGQYPSGYDADHDFLFARFNADGARDVSFVSNTGIPGVIRMELGFDKKTFDDGDTVILDPSNRVIGIGGRTFQDEAVSDKYIGVGRLTTTGAVDTTFGEDKNGNGVPDGFYFTQILGGSQDEAYAMAVQPADGKVVLGGWTDTGVTADFAVTRFLANGDPDTTFGGGDGIATRDNAGRQDTGRALVLQGDGKIVLAGDSYGGAGAPTPSMTVMRFNTDGSFDNTFGGGVVTTTFGTNGNTPHAIAIDLSGRILVGGSVSDLPGNWDFGLARFTAAGALDTSFDGDGKLRVDVGTGQNFDQISAITVQPDGKILVGGTTNSGSQSQFVVARFNDNGTPDNAFGGNGNGRHLTRVSSPSVPFAGDFVHGIVLLPDGRIVLAGKALDPTGPPGQDGNPQSFNAFALARFNANGTLDTSFDGDGKKTLNLLQYEMGEIFSIARQVDDKIVAFGNSQSLITGAADMALMRFNWDDGSIDTTFATNGSILTDVAGFDRGFAVAVQAGGKIVGGGTRGGNDFMALRFLGDPAPKVPGALDLVAGSDSFSLLTVPPGSNTDDLTNDNTPTFNGTCETGETVILRVGGAPTAPLSRFLCRNSAYSVTTAAGMADGPYSFTAISRNGAGDSTATAALAVTIDTVALPPTVSEPLAGTTINPEPTIRGGGAEAGAYVAVTNQAGGGAVCSTNADGSGNWQCATTLGPGAYTVLVRQTDRAGNTSNPPTSRSFTIKAPTTTTIASDPVSQSVFGQQVNISVTVDAGVAYNPVTGPVNFLVDTVGAGSPNLDGNGAAAIMRSNLAVGNHTFSATYPESAFFFGSGPSIKSFTVVKADTTTSIVVSPAPSVVGEAVTITYTIAPVAPGAGTPTGTVTVTDGTQSCTGAAPGGNCTITYTSPGVRNLTAAYPGDGNFNLSATGAATPHTVNKAATSTTITADTPDPSVVAELVTVNFTVAVTAPGAGVPTGNVTVTDGVDSCTGTISAAGTGTCSVSLATLGARTLVATYAGDANFLGSPSAGEAHEVQNRPPVLNDQTFTPIPENSPAGTVAGVVAATDPDAGQTITFSITAGNTGGAFAIDPASGQVTVANSAALDYEVTSSFVLTVQATDSGVPSRSDTGLISIALTNVNEAPSIAPQTRGPLPENTAAGALVGAVVTASDQDAGQSVSFAIIAGNVGSAFAINPASGQITLAGALDFETTASYSLTVQVTDNAAPPLSSSAVVTVAVGDVNEAPVVNDQAFAVVENSASGAAVGGVVATDVDAGQTLTYAITAGNGLGGFAINAGNGQITVADASVVDFEVNTSFVLTVSVTDSGTGALSDTAQITITVTNANDAPVLSDATLGALAENSANGSVAGAITGADEDPGQQLTYAITAGNTGNAFAIDPATGQVTVATSAALDFETTPVFTLTVTATDNGAPAASDTAVVTIPLSDVNDGPAVTPATFSLAENTVVGAAVGTVVATDADTGQTLTYAITAGNASGAFAIDAATGAVSVADASPLDFETTPLFALTVSATDNAVPPTSGQATVNITLTNVNESPVMNDQALGVAENSAAGTNAGTVVATDPDAGSVLTYAITSGNTGGAFAIDPGTGALTVANTAALDFETTPTFSLTVSVTDAGSLSDTATVTMSVVNANEAPVIAAQAFGPLAENSAAGTAVGTVSAIDPDVGQALSYAITAGNTGGAFAIHAGTGQLTVQVPAALDFETTPSFALTVSVTDNDASPLTRSATVTVGLSDANDAPRVAAQALPSVNENTSAGTVVGTVVSTDQDGGQTRTLAITGGNSGNPFAINATTGQVTVATPSALVFARTPVITLTVTATDNGVPVASGSGSVSIPVNRMAISVADAAVLEGQAGTSTLVFNVSLTAPSAQTVSVQYATANGTATAGTDYAATSGALTFAPGTSTRTVSVTVNGERNFEGDELLVLNLSAPVNGVLGDAQGVGTITDDEARTAGDFNLDGKSDILWRNAVSGNLFAWLMDGVTLASGASFQPEGVAATSWKVAGLGDFNNDGKVDILWRHDAGYLYVWYLDGLALTHAEYLEPNLVEPEWRVKAIADFNQDGRADLIWEHQDGTVVSWLMNGSKVSEVRYLNPNTGGSGWHVAGAGDFDLDGDSDVLWRHTDGWLFLWHMDGTNLVAGRYVEPNLEPRSSWQVAAVGDYNGDGKPDILWHQADGGYVFVWLMDGTTRSVGRYLDPNRVADLHWQIAGPR